MKTFTPRKDSTRFLADRVEVLEFRLGFSSFQNQLLDVWAQRRIDARLPAELSRERGAAHLLQSIMSWSSSTLGERPQIECQGMKVRGLTLEEELSDGTEAKISSRTACCYVPPTMAESILDRLTSTAPETILRTETK